MTSLMFPPARSVKRHENQANDQMHGGKAQDFNSCTTVAAPCVLVEGFLRPPRRDAERESFLIWALKQKQTLSAAGTRPYTPSLFSSICVPRYLSPGCCVRCCVIPVSKQTRTYIRVFPIGITQSRNFAPDQ